jgi:hypothetical protein
MSHFFALTLWLAACAMAVSVPLEFQRLKGWGEGAVEVHATVLEHAQGVSRPWPPGSYWTAVKVRWTGADGQTRETWLYDLDPDIPPVGSVVALVHPPDRPDTLGRRIPARQRWQKTLGFGVWTLIVASLGAMVSFGGAGPPWIRFLPAWLVAAGLTVLGASTVSVTWWDRVGQVRHYMETEGTVVELRPAGSRKVGGMMQAAWDVAIAYEVDGATFETLWSANTSPPDVGSRLLVRYNPDRPSVALIEAQGLHLWGMGVGVGMALLSLTALVWITLRWVRAG